METEQTGFSGSSPNAVAGVPATGSTCSDDGNNGDSTPATPGAINRNQTYYNHSANEITIKNEPEDDTPTVVVTSNQAPLPSISEENWRAYYQHPLVVLNGGVDESVSAIYEAAYKLPSLAKFGKGLSVGKLPAIWSVSVAPQEGELITPHPPEPESPGQPNDLSTSTIFLRGPEGRVIVHQSVDREDSVIQPVPDKGEGGKAEGGQALPLLAPTAVAVKGGVVVDEGEHQEVEMEPVRQRELQVNGSAADMQLEGTQYQVSEFSPSPYEGLGTGQYSVLTNVVVTVAPPQYGTQTAVLSTAPSVYTLTTPGDYYRESADQQYAQAVRQHLAAYPAEATPENVAYVERYIRQNFKHPPHGLAVDLPSPDSGIGGEESLKKESWSKEDSLDQAPLQIFDYAEITQGHPSLLQPPTDEDSSTSRSTPVPSSSPARKNSWNHEYGRNAELDKVQIPKIFSEVGFRYYLESPISTSQRREDDRMTYINKGQYYGITLEYINDPQFHFKGSTVKSTVMLVFREEKSQEDELKAWKFWHSRQHSVKQRILDVDTKNSSGTVSQIEEKTHNAISFYWNPLDGPAKISVSVHCLSTDFSNQKGVKGFPLHLQVDTTDDFRENAPPIHRGYCQIKVFCDKGAERKTRDEERRAAKRKLTATGSGDTVFTGSRKKIEEMYHVACERSEFYSMSDLSKPPILFTPDEDTERSNGPELTFYAIATTPTEDNIVIPDKTPIELPVSPPMKKFKLAPADRELTVSYWDSVLLYVRRMDEDLYLPLHIMPPSLAGLAKALEEKYHINSELIRHFYKKCKKGITVLMDDDMVRLYCNEDSFILDIIKTEDNKYDVTLEEL